MTRKIIVLALFAGIWWTGTLAQAIDKKKLDSLFDMLNNRGLANGSVAISVNGKIEYRKSIGFAKSDSRFRIGSVTKMFTAALTLQLIDEGKLSLGEKLVTYFPQLPNAGKITIEQLLRHRSGLHDYTNETNYQQWLDKPKSREEMLQLIADKGSDFEPGSKADYSNSNYLLLTYIVEKISNMSFAEVLEKRIIAKSSLKNTYYGNAIDINRREIASYKYSDSSWRKEKESALSIHAGAGALVSTPSDLVKFIESLFAQKLISKQSLDQMTTLIDYYGMGMFPYGFDGQKGFGHNGRVEEFYSALRYYPEKKLAICYITNGILYPRNDILDGIVKICFNKPYTIPFSTSADNKLEKYTGEYSSPDLPFKILCSINNGSLRFEFAGKAMQATPVSTDYFMHLPSGSFFSFYPEKGELHIKETDNTYVLSRSK